MSLAVIVAPTEDGSPAFTQFLDLLGDTITLKGWQQYKGGLDTRCKLNNEYSKNPSTHTSVPSDNL